jgi:CubicO group peptidase (beta-lactamase class C family)
MKEKAETWSNQLEVDSGLSRERLSRLSAAIHRDIEGDLYDGAAIIVARHGIIGLQEAIGFADRATRRPLHIDDVFQILSVTKAFTDALVLSYIERGKLALTTRVAEVIPEFAGKLKDRVTVHHLFTHSSGMPTIFFPTPGKLIGNLNAVVEALCKIDLAAPPGEKVLYCPLSGHALLAEMVRRVDGGQRSLRKIYQDELFGPLRMKDTAMGKRRDLKPRIVPIVMHEDLTGPMTREEANRHNDFISEDAEMPWMGCVSTAPDLFRFAEMLRLGGELDGVRILSPVSIQMATSIQTGLKEDEFLGQTLKFNGWDPGPANIGLDFLIRGTGVRAVTFLGSLSSPRTFGKYGMGGTMFLIDPERDITYLFLSAGLLEEYHNACRLQRLSDMVMASVI